MKRIPLLLTVALAATLWLTAPLAEAKRLGGGKAVGMQRQAPAKPAEGSPPPTPVQPANAATNAATNPAQAAPMAGAAAPAKRSWLGPVAGLAAGLGLAALFSHLGWGEGFANVMTMALLAVVAVVAVRWLMRRFAGGPARPMGGLQPAGAGAPWPAGRVSEPPLNAAPLQRASAAPAAASALPEGVDAAEFERVAKMIFIRMQAANDAGAVDDLRKFTTPELFAALRLDLHERGGVAQQTDVVQLAAQVVDSERQAEQWVVSVRFSGLIREVADGGAQPFDETWHLVRPADGSREWAIAGIAPTVAA